MKAVSKKWRNTSLFSTIFENLLRLSRMQVFRILPFLFLIFYLPFVGYGQRYSFIEYNTSKGLPQSQVTSITQDSSGYLWIGTFGGLSQFNGEEFVKIGRRSGLLNNRISKLAYLNNKIHIGHPQGISIKDDVNSFISYPFYDDQVLTSISGFFYLDSILYVSTNGEGLFYLNDEHKSLIKVENSPPRIRDVIFFEEEIFLATKTGVYTFSNNEFINLTEHFEIEMSFSGFDTVQNHLYTTCFNGALFEYNDLTKSFNLTLENDDFLFRNITIDNKGNKWLYSGDGVLYIKEKDTIKFQEKSGLPTNDINTIFEDSERNIWLGTNGKGLIRFTDEVFSYYNEKSGFPSDLIIAIEIDRHDNKWISTIDQGVFLMKQDGSIHHIDYIKNAVWQIMSVNDLVLFGSDYGLFIYDYNDFKSIYSEDGELPSDRITGLHKIDNSTVLISTTEGGAFFNSIDKQFTSETSVLTQIAEIRSLRHTTNKTYAAANNILYTIENNHKKEIKFDSRINCLELDDNNTLWIGTENGLYIDKNDSIELFLLNKNEELEFVNFMQKYDSLIFVGTNNGVYEISNSLKHQFRYGINSGLIDLETNLNSNFLDDNHFLWFGTAFGLMKMNLKLRTALMKDFPPKLKLENVLINNKSVDFSLIHPNDKLIFKWKDKNISFKFDGIYLSSHENLVFSYFLEGFSNEWSNYNKNPLASFTNLPAGTYELKFKVINTDTKIFSEETIKFKILPPFHQTWWFYSIIIGLIISLMIAIEKVRANRIRQKNYRMRLEFQNKLKKLEQQSLNASMNRHFIFNSLNSIQYYINISDTKSANRYLSKFAKLIRKNLDSSYNEDGMVNLSDELDRLKLYLELESMRFVGKFDYSIEIEDRIEADVLNVPAMFLQPFVENSIIHGILPLKDKKGKITISVDDHLDHIRIKIEDNGIGIENSKNQKEPSENEHLSQGMMITKNRIKLLQQFSEQSISMIGPYQINENDSLINGTVVIFKILKHYLA